jgi:hypothetical protein
MGMKALQGNLNPGQKKAGLLSILLIAAAEFCREQLLFALGLKAEAHQ